jgi:hypothetical protein
MSSVRPRFQSLVVLLSVSVLAACASREASKTADSATSVTPQHVDSILPRAEELARFRRGLGDSVAELNSPFRSRDALVDAFVKRLQTRDTTGLVALAMSKSEFAWIYYPTNPIGLPPYDLSAGLMWFRLEGNSRKGLVHALEDRGGRDLRVVGYSCESTDTEGENRIHNRCALKRVQAPGDTIAEILFGGIIEHHGRFKLIGFTNKL